MKPLCLLCPRPRSYGNYLFCFRCSGWRGPAARERRRKARERRKEKRCQA